jgi:hypothetical protein
MSNHPLPGVMHMKLPASHFDSFTTVLQEGVLIDEKGGLQVRSPG